MAKITAPVKGYNGTTASVDFTDGVGETNNPWLLEWFKQHGYQIEAEPEAPQEAQNEPQADETAQPEAEGQPAPIKPKRKR